MTQLTQYLWIVIVAFLFGFLYAFGIGANDVANAFGSTVASKSLTLKQAVLVATIFEFLGAFLLGAAVTNTIRSKIFDPDLYTEHPDIIMLGMFSAVMTGTIMLWTATYFAMPVSTTHTIVGSIMGFSIAAKGFDSINWNVVTQILISWIVSPLVSGIVGFCFFGSLRLFVLHTEHPFERAYYTFPIVLTIFIGIDIFYVLYKGFNNVEGASDIPLSTSLPTAFAVGFAVGLFWIFLWGPFTRKRIERIFAEREATEAKKQEWDEIDVDGDGTTQKVAAPDSDEEAQEATEGKPKAGAEEDGADAEAEEEAPAPVEEKNFFKRSLATIAANTYDQDLHAQSMHESQRAAEIWDNSEQYDPKAEFMFTYVQIFTACLNSFAHGANDVANAIAPLSAILLIYQTGELESKSPVEKWILAYGGIGIVVGLLLYGYKVMKSIGYKLCCLSPSRGASAELAASLFVVTASFLGIPVSSTQSICGAVTGVGCVNGFRNVDWWFFLRVCLSWATIFILANVVGAGIFSMMAYSPSLNAPVVVNITDDE
jgi:solute carrier family 20 (sodium-dependent phosphate transporter)